MANHAIMYSKRPMFWILTDYFRKYTTSYSSYYTWNFNKMWIKPTFLLFRLEIINLVKVFKCIFAYTSRSLIQPYTTWLRYVLNHVRNGFTVKFHDPDLMGERLNNKNHTAILSHYALFNIIVFEIRWIYKYLWTVQVTHRNKLL